MVKMFTLWLLFKGFHGPDRFLFVVGLIMWALAWLAQIQSLDGPRDLTDVSPVDIY